MFKVRCRLVSFDGDEELFPCHFNYKIGDEFYYDGVYFTGRICPGLFATMMPVVHGIHLSGNRFGENIMYKYRGLDVRNPDMKAYDGEEFHPRKSLPENAPENMKTMFSTMPRTEKVKGGRFACTDTRTLAQFRCEAVDLSDSDYCLPFYRRSISILEKIEAEPEIKTAEILSRFTDFELDDISPPLTPVLLQILSEALTDMGYIEIHDGRATATGKEPPSRPK
ncbi:MAG: TIGR04076 family protein [Deltaproteobacteria bacterium]|nr:TIGR04076 family protein [Deltaproteobacteria bacterium]